jgi:hypothetical protein
MANYKPKSSYISSGRLDKLVKDVVKDAASDRTSAMEAYDAFKIMHDSGSQIPGMGIEYAKYMLDALKLCQTANDRTLKAIQIMQKTLEVIPLNDDANGIPDFKTLKASAKERKNNEKK